MINKVGENQWASPQDMLREDEKWKKEVHISAGNFYHFQMFHVTPLGYGHYMEINLPPTTDLPQPSPA